MKHFILCIIVLSFEWALAHDHEAQEDISLEYRVLKEVSLSETQKVYLVAREDGHLLGQPYQIEVRVRCDGEKLDIIELPVKDSFSVCDMQPESVKINKAKTAMAMKVKVVDLKHYEDQLEAGQKSPDVRCHKKTEIKKFSLKKLCPSNT